MSYIMRSRHLTFGIIFFLLALAVPFCTFDQAQANSAVPLTFAGQTVCHPAVQQGWRPYRISANDSLETLALRAQVSVAELIEINCLENKSLGAGDLLLMPAKLADLPTATPTTEPTLPPTEEPTQEPTVAPTVIPNAAPVEEAGSNTLTVTQTSADIAAISETLALSNPANATVAITVAITTTAVTVAESMTTTVPLLTVISTTATISDVVETATPDPQPAASGDSNNPPSSALGEQGGMMTLIFFLAAVASIFAFILRPRPTDSPAMHRLFSLLGNFVFLFAGLLVGLIYFPTIQPISLTDLPTATSAMIAVTLIGLLAIKEIFLAGSRWHTMSRLLNFGIVPLLVLFFVTIADRVADVMR